MVVTCPACHQDWDAKEFGPCCPHPLPVDQDPRGLIQTGWMDQKTEKNANRRRNGWVGREWR